MHFSCFYTCHMSLPSSHPPHFFFTRRTSVTSTNLKLLITQVSPVSCYLVLSGPHTFLRTLLLRTLSLQSSLIVRDQFHANTKQRAKL
jgi:hypothetical protein